MSRIRSKNTAPELLVRKYLYKKGFRYRLYTSLPGTPDIVLPRLKTVIFIHGCFWHAHKDCPYFKLPKTRTEWWQLKFEKNKERDRVATLKLQEKGWNVIIVWECMLKPKNKYATLHSLEVKLNKILLKKYSIQPLDNRISSFKCPLDNNDF